MLCNLSFVVRYALWFVVCCFFASCALFAFCRWVCLVRNASLFVVFVVFRVARVCVCNVFVCCLLLFVVSCFLIDDC